MTATRCYYRAEFLVGNDDTTLWLTDPIVHVASRHEDSIEIWWEHDADGVSTERTFRVVATGEEFDQEKLRHIGSAVTPSGRYVWHLMEVTQ